MPASASCRYAWVMPVSHHCTRGETASQRLAAALGRPAPRPLSDDQLAEFDAEQDALDAEVERIYRRRAA